MATLPSLACAGRNSSVLRGLDQHAGGNPSVNFNSFLKKWLMVWATWDQSSPSPNSIWLSTSDNLLNWSPPKVVLKASGRERYWYPTVVGDSDVSSGEEGPLVLHAYFPDKARHEREFRVQDIVFTEASEGRQSELCWEYRALNRQIAATPAERHKDGQRKAWLAAFAPSEREWPFSGPQAAPRAAILAGYSSCTRLR